VKLARQVLVLLAAMAALAAVTVLPAPPQCVRADSPAGVHTLIVVENCTR